MCVWVSLFFCHRHRHMALSLDANHCMRMRYLLMFPNNSDTKIHRFFFFKCESLILFRKNKNWMFFLFFSLDYLIIFIITPNEHTSEQYDLTAVHESHDKYLFIFFLFLFCILRTDCMFEYVTFFAFAGFCIMNAKCSMTSTKREAVNTPSSLIAFKLFVLSPIYTVASQIFRFTLWIRLMWVRQRQDKWLHQNGKSVCICCWFYQFFLVFFLFTCSQIWFLFDCLVFFYSQNNNFFDCVVYI